MTAGSRLTTPLHRDEHTDKGGREDAKPAGGLTSWRPCRGRRRRIGSSLMLACRKTACADRDMRRLRGPATPRTHRKVCVHGVCVCVCVCVCGVKLTPAPHQVPELVGDEGVQREGRVELQARQTPPQRQAVVGILLHVKASR
jgi:hypothetical protein